MELQGLPTSELEVKCKKEQERVFQYLMRVYPISPQSLEMLLADLKKMKAELDSRNS